MSLRAELINSLYSKIDSINDSDIVKLINQLHDNELYEQSLPVFDDEYEINKVKNYYERCMIGFHKIIRDAHISDRCFKDAIEDDSENEFRAFIEYFKVEYKDLTKVILWGHDLITFILNTGFVCALKYIRILFEECNFPVDITIQSHRESLLRGIAANNMRLCEIIINQTKDVNFICNERPPWSVGYDDYSPLMMACGCDNVDAIHMLLKHPSIDINLKNKHGETALSLAIKRKSINVINILLNQPELDVPNSSFSDVIDYCDDEQCVSFIQKRRFNDEPKILAKALLTNKPLTISEVLKHNVDVNYIYDDCIPLSIAIEMNSPFIDIIYDRTNEEMFHRNDLQLIASAITARNIPMLNKLIVRGARPSPNEVELILSSNDIEILNLFDYIDITIPTNYICTCPASIEWIVSHGLIMSDNNIQWLIDHRQEDIIVKLLKSKKYKTLESKLVSSKYFTNCMIKYCTETSLIDFAAANSMRGVEMKLASASSTKELTNALSVTSDVNIAKLLIEHGANIHEEQLIFKLIKHGRRNVAELLLSLGVNKYTLINNETVVDCLLSYFPNAFDVMKKYDIDINHRYEGGLTTAMMFPWHIIELAEHGAVIDAKDDNGKSVLAYVIDYCGEVERVKYVLERVKDVNVDEITPLVRKSLDRNELIKMLKEHGIDYIDFDDVD